MELKRVYLQLVFGIWARKLCDIYSSIGCALSSFRPPLGPPFDFLLNFCSCQTARCFNKSKGVLITGLKLKAFRNPQPSWGFSIDNKKGLRFHVAPCFICWRPCNWLGRWLSLLGIFIFCAKAQKSGDGVDMEGVLYIF